MVPASCGESSRDAGTNCFGNESEDHHSCRCAPSSCGGKQVGSRQKGRHDHGKSHMPVGASFLWRRWVPPCWSTRLWCRGRFFSPAKTSPGSRGVHGSCMRRVRPVFRGSVMRWHHRGRCSRSWPWCSLWDMSLWCHNCHRLESKVPVLKLGLAAQQDEQSVNVYCCRTRCHSQICGDSSAGTTIRIVPAECVVGYP